MVAPVLRKLNTTLMEACCLLENRVLLEVNSLSSPCWTNKSLRIVSVLSLLLPRMHRLLTREKSPDWWLDWMSDTSFHPVTVSSISLASHELVGLMYKTPWFMEPLQPWVAISIALTVPVDKEWSVLPSQPLSPSLKSTYSFNESGESGMTGSLSTSPESYLLYQLIHLIESAASEELARNSQRIAFLYSVAAAESVSKRTRTLWKALETMPLHY